MSHAQEASGIADDDLAATQTPGYKPGEKRDLNELANLDADDEALRKWKASLGVTADGAGAAAGGKTTVKLVCLRLHSPDLKQPIHVDLSNPAKLADLKKNSNVTIKEGVEYSVELEFQIEGGLISGMKYIQVAKRGPVKVDKLEEMVGSYGPNPSSYKKRFQPEEAPSGMLARGTYSVRSRVTDDDGTVHADWEWQFKIAKTWES